MRILAYRTLAGPSEQGAAVAYAGEQCPTIEEQQKSGVSAL
jgi:hypothetical protein